MTVVSDFTLTDFSNVCCHGDSVLDWIPEEAAVGSELDFGCEIKNITNVNKIRDSVPCM